MRRRNWIMAAILCAGILLAVAQTVRAEPDEASPEEPVAASEDTSTPTRSRSTYEWEAITDEFGVTVYPPPPDEGGPDNGPTTTTKKTSRTTAPYQYNPDHPDDNYTGALGMPNLPNFNAAATDIYGNEITRILTEPPTSETTTEVPTSDGGTTEESTPEEPAIQARPFNWAVAGTAGGLLLAAAAGVSVMLAKNRRDGGEDDYIDEEEEFEEEPEEE